MILPVLLFLANQLLFASSFLIDDSRPNVAIDKEQSAFILHENHLGAYISSAYLAELKTHGSTKRAQEKASMSTAVFSEVDKQYFFQTTWNFHEGGEKDIVRMLSNTLGLVISFEGDTLYRLDFSKPLKLRVIGEGSVYELSKVSSDYENPRFNEVVNETLLSGTYKHKKNTLTFSKDGKVTGLDSIQSYSFNMDYLDAGMDFDKIYLRSDNGQSRYFGYEFKDGQFIVFELECVVSEEDNPQLCVQHLKGDVIYKLKKISK